MKILERDCLKILLDIEPDDIEDGELIKPLPSDINTIGPCAFRGKNFKKYYSGGHNSYNA